MVELVRNLFPLLVLDRDRVPPLVLCRNLFPLPMVELVRNLFPLLVLYRDHVPLLVLCRNLLPLLERKLVPRLLWTGHPVMVLQELPLPANLQCVAKQPHIHDLLLASCICCLRLALLAPGFRLTTSTASTISSPM